ncbi:MAG: rRNA adenine N-6-methyltransferase family protein [Egibacteraceae bacterium]
MAPCARTVSAWQRSSGRCGAVGRSRRTARDERRRTHQQNFLTDARVVRRLVADVEPDELVVDVGAGTGVLTLAVAAAGARVLAVERDPVWSQRLRARVREAGLDERVRVVLGDLRAVALPVGRWRVIASPPFGLTTTLLRRLLDDPARGPARADLVLQFEVTRKFAAHPPTTLLGSSWAPWWETTLVERIPRTSFRPIPGSTWGGCVSEGVAWTCCPQSSRPPGRRSSATRGPLHGPPWPPCGRPPLTSSGSAPLLEAGLDDRPRPSRARVERVVDPDARASSCPQHYVTLNSRTMPFVKCGGPSPSGLSLVEPVPMKHTIA